MTRPVSPESFPKEIGKQGFRIERVENRILAHAWFEPTLLNSWAQPSPPLERFAIRIHTDYSLEFKGHLNAAAATSATVAFNIPGATAGYPSYRILGYGGAAGVHDQYFHTTITTDDGTTFTLALVFISSTSWDVKITWPVS
jgi:hypothetical protein